MMNDVLKHENKQLVRHLQSCQYYIFKSNRNVFKNCSVRHQQRLFSGNMHNEAKLIQLTMKKDD